MLVMMLQLRHCPHQKISRAPEVLLRQVPGRSVGDLQTRFTIEMVIRSLHDVRAISVYDFGPMACRQRTPTMQSCIERAVVIDFRSLTTSHASEGALCNIRCSRVSPSG